MHSVVITPLYAALIAIVFVILSVRTLRLRRRFSVAIGSGEEPALARAARAHANCAEYVPIALLLILFMELRFGTGIWIHAFGSTLLVGRIVHAFGISQVTEDYRFRVAGMALTFTVIIGTSLRLIYGFFANA